MCLNVLFIHRHVLTKRKEVLCCIYNSICLQAIRLGKTAIGQCHNSSPHVKIYFLCRTRNNTNCIFQDHYYQLALRMPKTCNFYLFIYRRGKLRCCGEIEKIHRERRNPTIRTLLNKYFIARRKTVTQWRAHSELWLNRKVLFPIWCIIKHVKQQQQQLER